MTDTKLDIDVKILAKTFCDKLLEELGDVAFEELVEAQTVNIDPNICCSHDFCDANMVMLDAFMQISGMSDDDAIKFQYSEHGVKIVNEAWELAATSLFNTKEI